MTGYIRRFTKKGKPISQRILKKLLSYLRYLNEVYVMLPPEKTPKILERIVQRLNAGVMAKLKELSAPRPHQRQVRPQNRNRKSKGLPYE